MPDTSQGWQISRYLQTGQYICGFFHGKIEVARIVIRGSM